MAKDWPVSHSGLLRSTDTGKTWHLVRADGPVGESATMAIDPPIQTGYSRFCARQTDSLHLR
jgi:hypothetical protein